MNKYPVWWEQDLTVYNRYEDESTQLITWYRHNLSGCFWKYKRDVLKINSTTLETNSIICRIPKDDSFKEKYEWIDLYGSTIANYWTLGVGDIIVKGNVTDDISEYTAGSRSSDLIAKYKNLQGCMQIKVVSINTGTGRCDEHYYVSGD